MSSQHTHKNTDDPKLKLIVFKACHVAVWSDSKMMSEERQFLSHLTETLCKTQAQRKAFREIQLQDVNEGLVLSEIKSLSKEEKAYIFDTCLETLASDKRITLPELRFLDTLRKACGVGRWSYQKKITKTLQSTRAKIPRRKLILLLTIIVSLLPTTAYIIFKHKQMRTAARPLREKCTGKEISVRMAPAVNSPISQSSTSQDVFDKVRDSIVTINVFVNYTPVCGGSGSVIGTDDSGTVYIITNRHVVKNSDILSRGTMQDRVKVEVQQHSGAKFDATLDFYSRQYDLALLAVKGMKEYTKPLHINLKSGLRVGQRIYAVGSPLGLDHSITEGVVSAFREDYLQTDATIHSGSSGGPLIDQQGSLCGVVTRGHLTKDYGFALYSDAILEMLKERKRLKRVQFSK
jgi:S1-C subfamily serine protease